MIPDHQTRFIHKIRNALKKTGVAKTESVSSRPDRPGEKTKRLLHGVHHRSGADKDELLQRLLQSAKPINLNVLPCKDAMAAANHIRELAVKKKPEWSDQRRIIAWHHPLIHTLDLANALSGDGIPVFCTDPDHSDRDIIRRHAVDAHIGITSADFCMADTATLVMKTRPGQARSVSLLPSIHIAVMEQKRLIADMKELFALLQWDEKEKREGLTNGITFISGPSKTADIEATMVLGAHGPREVYLYVITG